MIRKKEEKNRIKKGEVNFMKLSNVKAMVLSVGAGAAILALGSVFSTVPTFGKNSPGFAMGTGNQNIEIAGNSNIDEKMYMSFDDEIQVRSGVSEELCNKTCQSDIYDMVQKYASELEGMTVSITDDAAYGLIQKEADVLYVNFNITEDFMSDFLINR